MSKKHRQELEKLKQHFAKNKKKALKSLLLAPVFFFLAAAIIGLKLLYPFHFFVAAPFLVLSISFFFRAFFIDFSRKAVKQSAIFSSSLKFLKLHRKKIGWSLAGLALIFIIIKVIPAGINPFRELDQAERSALIEDDLQRSVIIMDNLEIAGQDMIDSPLLKKKGLTADEDQELRDKWNYFLSAAMESERLTDVHQYFNRINILTQPDEHAKSFIIAYSLYVKKYELFHRLIGRIDNNERIIKSLNEYSPVFGGKDSYVDILDRFYSSGSLLRRNLGRTYAFFLGLTKDESELGENYAMLKVEAKKSHTYLIKSFPETAVSAVKDQRSSIERNLFKTWFPVQKNVANMMGEIYVARRHEKLIRLEQIAEFKQKLEPGDILIERRNWYVSNVGIPGFWPHAALHIGTPDEAQQYFADLFPREGYTDFRSLLAARFPRFLERYQGVDEKNFPLAVLEAKAPGVILQSIEESAYADYVAAMRPRLSKEDKFKALLRAFENYSKPYDYNFDFETRDELVCSELVYDAYIPQQGKRGLDFPLALTAGRKMVSPTDMARKYYEEKEKTDRQLDFVYFLDGNEKLGKAFPKDESDFATSWTRPKYDWFQE